MKNEDFVENLDHFYVVVDKEGDITHVDHPEFGEMVAVFRTFQNAKNALARAVDREQWDIIPAEIFHPEDDPQNGEEHF